MVKRMERVRIKKRKSVFFLAAEAVLCVVFGLLHTGVSDIFSTVAAFPFEQIGWVLRKLSMSGMAGNVVAIVFYVAVSLVPCMVWFWLKQKKRIRKVDMTLWAISIFLFVMNYYMVNPGLFWVSVPGTGKWMLGSTFYSLLFGYLVIRFLEGYRMADTKKLQRGVKSLLFCLNILFVFLIFGQNANELADSVHNTQTQEAVIFLVLHYIVDSLPYLLNILVVFLTLRMLEALAGDNYSDEAVEAAEKLSGFCKKALEATVISGAGFNLLQMIGRRWMAQIDIVIVIPVFSVVFVLAVMLFARYIRENQKLKRDNELFI